MVLQVPADLGLIGNRNDAQTAKLRLLAKSRQHQQLRRADCACAQDHLGGRSRDVPKSYRLDLVSNTASSNGILMLKYRRHR